MATTQYIGSRYVPIFADPTEWSSAKTYEPLTIVLHQGNSFTSKQFVPIGIDIDNTNFWAETGNYNAQVELYRLEVNAFDDRINARIEAFDTVADMQDATDLRAGMTCHTNGFHSADDGGAAYYTISSSGTANDKDVLACKDGLFASLVSDGTVNIKQLGAVGDGVTDDAEVLAHAISHYDNIIVLDSLAISHVDCIGLNNKVINGFGKGSFVSIDQYQKLFSNAANGTEDGIHNVTFEGLSFVGSGYYNGLTWNADRRDSGIDVKNANRCTVRNCTFYNFGCIAIRIAEGSLSSGGGNIIEGNHIYTDITFTGSDSPLNYNLGIGLSGADNVIRDNVVTNCIQCIYVGSFVKSIITGNRLTSVHQHCLYFGSGSNSIISENVMDASAGITCIKLQHASDDSSVMEKITISGNNLIGSGDQSILATELHATGSGVTINDIVINDNNIVGKRCIHCIKTNRVVISGNRCTTNMFGIFLSYATNTIVNGCHLECSTSEGSTCGVTCDNADYVSVNSSVISGFRYGVSAGASSSCRFINNVFKAVGTGLLSLQSGTDLVLEISGNEFILDPVTFAIGTTIGFGTRIQAGKTLIARNNTFKEVGSDALTVGLTYVGLSDAAYVIGNVSINNKYGFRRNSTMDALTHADANFWNSELVG